MHTKGPWKANFSPRLNVKGADGKSICATVMGAGRATRPYEEARGNIRLISAAPDLLDACKAAVAMLSSGKVTENDKFVISLLTPAITKAEGIQNG